MHKPENQEIVERYIDIIKEIHKHDAGVDIMYYLDMEHPLSKFMYALRWQEDLKEAVQECEKLNRQLLNHTTKLINNIEKRLKKDNIDKKYLEKVRMEVYKIRPFGWLMQGKINIFPAVLFEEKTK